MPRGRVTLKWRLKKAGRQLFLAARLLTSSRGLRSYGHASNAKTSVRGCTSSVSPLSASSAIQRGRSPNMTASLRVD